MPKVGCFKNTNHNGPFFQNLMSSWGVGVRFSKLPFSHDFFKIMPKVGCFKNTNDNGPFFQHLMSSWGVDFNYCGRSFNQAPTLSLRVPAQFTDEARSAEFHVWVDGWVGRNIKSVLQIFILFWKNHTKSKVFQKHERQQPFFELFVRFQQNFDIFRNFVYRDFFCKIDPFLIFFSKILRFSDFRLKGFLLKKK